MHDIGAWATQTSWQEPKSSVELGLRTPAVQPPKHSFFFKQLTFTGLQASLE